ncbi:MAG TPA: hypothetical protein PK997_01130 [Candidatus Omnitrophota bacterium]|nr:hypothetical protein [Candidatus Omnitrophota bacterium]
MKTQMFESIAWFLVLTFCFSQVAPSGMAAVTPLTEEKPLGVAQKTQPAAQTEEEKIAALPTTVPSGAHEQFFSAGPLSLSVPARTEEKAIQTDPVTGDAIGSNVSVDKEDLPSHISRFIGTETPLVRKPPQETKIVTDPSAGKELSVTINDRGIATVKWGDQEYKGFYDPRTNSVIIVTKDDTIWTLQFAAKEDGSVYLESFKTNFGPLGGVFEETYTFNAQGQLIRKDWLTENSLLEYRLIYKLAEAATLCAGPERGGCLQPVGPLYRSGGTIDYVTINGKTLVSHEKLWSERGIRLDRQTDSESWYSYDGQGNLTAKVWETRSDFGSSYGRETYVQINGKVLLSSSMVWRYNEMRKKLIAPDIIKLDEPSIAVVARPTKINLYVSSHTETFYTYDEEGNLVSELSATEGYDRNNIRHTSGTLLIRDAARNTWTLVAAEGINPFTVWFRQDTSEIRMLAQRMTVYVGGNGERYNYTHRVEYTRNAGNSLAAKAVYDNAGNVSIIQGEPDVLSGETDDITIVNGQQVSGYTAKYQEYWHDGVNDGYRLVFYDSNWNATAVDFPAQNTVVLNGIENKIVVDRNGNILLESMIPPAVQAYVEALQSAVGSRYTVNVLRQENGMYLISVRLGDSCQPVCKVVILPKPGEMTGMSFSISADGTPDVSTLAVAYNVPGTSTEAPPRGVTQPAVDAQLLYEALQQLMDRGHPVFMKLPPVIAAGPEDPSLRPDLSIKLVGVYVPVKIDPVLFTMIRISVTKVEDGAIHFVKDGVDYKCYRDAEGNVVVDKALPPAVQAYVEALQSALDARSSFYQVTVMRTDAGYQILVSLKTGGDVPVNTDQLGEMSFIVSDEGELMKGSLNVSYGGFVVDARLIYDAVRKLMLDNVQPGMGIAAPSSEQILAEISLVRISRVANSSTPAQPGLLIKYRGKGYRISRNADGTIHVDPVVAIPPAVQAFIDVLSKELGAAYVIDFDRENPFHITVDFNVNQCAPDGSWCTNGSLVPVMGQLEHLEFALKADGSIAVDTLNATFHGVFDPPGMEMLFEGLRGFVRRSDLPVETQVLVLMTEIVVKEVTAPGKILLARDGKTYKIFRDESKNVLLVRDIPGLPDNHLATYLDFVAAHFGVSADDIVSFAKYKSGMVCLGTGCPTWAIEVEFKAMLNGVLTDFNGIVNGPSWLGDAGNIERPAVKMPRGTLSETEQTATHGVSGEITALSFIPQMIVMAYNQVVRAVRSYTSVGTSQLAADLVYQSMVLAGGQGLGTTAVFAFEQGSILFARILTELTR